MIHVLFAIAATIFGLSGGEVTLPREAQRELDAFTAAVEKADNARQAAVNAAVDKAVKALNAAAQKAKTVEERRAIDDEILKITKQKVEVDPLGDKEEKRGKNPWVGKYKWYAGNSVEIFDDGTALYASVKQGSYTITDGKLLLKWVDGSSETVDPPGADGKTRVVSWKGEQFVYTKLREGAK